MLTRTPSPHLLQGENDAAPAGLHYYPCELSALAAAMRATHASPNAHWTTIQLAPYTGGVILAPFRSMQCATTAGIPNASCATLVDDGDVLSPIGSVHSRNKQLVGRRVAAGIAAALYGVPQPTGGAGPTFASAALQSTPNGALQALVSFIPESLGGHPLVYAPPVASTWSNSTRCPSELGVIKVGDCDWLNILGSDGRAYNATASLASGGTALLLQAQAPAGVKAVGTRFGWNAWPVVNWYNAAGLPLTPWNVTNA